MKRLCVLVLFLLCVLPGLAQTCTTATCTASSATETAFIAALPSSSNTNATVVVNWPAGNVSWTSDLTYTIPSAVTNLTIQGATTITWTGTAGQSSWNYSANDQTIIQDNDSSNNSVMVFVTGSATSKLRMTGLTIEEGTGAIKYNGDFNIGGSTRNFRFDHNHITGASSTGQNEWLRISVTGVIDHNALDENISRGNANGDNYFQAFNGAVDDTIGQSDGAWIDGPQFGTLLPLYIESNYFTGGISDDCNFGGRFVERYNTFNDMYVPIQTHGTKSSGGPQRGCIGYEAYNNYFLGSTSSPSSAATGSKGGTALLFNNTVATGYYRFYQASTDRNGGDNADEINNPNGWGYCGTSTLVPSTGSPNGTGSNWDGSGASSTGYPCLDGLGRGQDTQALNGQAFPSRLNSVTGTVAWPHQYLWPIYMWNNNFSGANPGVTYTLVTGDTTANTTNNLDYYYDQSAQSGSFTGAAGTGFGLLSARPATCTPGPGGTYGTSPTGSYGVAYFATDTQTLYVCDGVPANHWATVYTPYTYPHPLVTGLTSTSTSLASSNYSPATGATITLTATLSPSSGPTGTITYYDGGTSIGTSTLPTLTHTVTAITAGVHTYTAIYSGDGTYSTSSSSPITVTAGMSTTTTALVSSNSSPTAGTNITLTATVTPSSGPTGTVTYYDGGVSIGTSTLPSLTHTVTAITAGTHSYTATYSGDGTYATSTSSPTVVTASKLTTTTSLAASNNTPAAGTNITLTASITPSSGPTGTVTFFDGGSSIGTGTVSSGTATKTVTAITVGTHTYTATYGGDSSYSSSTSSPVTVTASGVVSGSALTTGIELTTGVAIR